MKTNGALSVQLYKYEEEPSIDVPAFVGMTVDELKNWAAQYGVVLNGTEDASECGLDRPVTVLTFSGLDGIVSIKPSELEGKSVNYSYCKVTIAPTPEPTVEPGTDTGSTESPDPGAGTE